MSEDFKLSGPIPKCDAFRAERTSAKQPSKLLKPSWREGGRTALSARAICGRGGGTRRFGIKQGQKTRPIDNYLESMANATASAVDTASLHSAEVIAAAIARRMKLLRSSKKSSSLLMRSWDLSKAYKHLPLHETYLSDAFLCVWNPNPKQAVLYGQRVLPFGARSSIHVLLQWTVFFDGFVVCESPSLASTFDLCADGLFSLLGWDIAQDQASNFDMIENLGLSVDMSDTSLGVVKLSNTENRKQEISDALEVFLQAGA